jgi:SagB-type dehydrogenase family enzyme
MERRSLAWEFHAATSYAGMVQQTFSVATSSEVVELPDAVVPESLDKAIRARASCRRFCPDPLAISDLAALLHSSYGVVGTATVNGFDFDHRPVPSAGARYPLHLFVLARSVDGLGAGAYRFDPSNRTLNPTGLRPDDPAIATVFMGQSYVATASAIIVIAADVGKTLERYADRGYRYVLFEAGHVAQNIALCAAMSGVGTLEIGGFLDEDLAVVLGLDGPWTVALYAAAVGYLASDDPAVTRSVE